MKFMGKYRVGCQCCYCIGKPGTATKKKIRKGQKSRDRCEAKKEINKHTGSSFDEFLEEEGILIKPSKD